MRIRRSFLLAVLMATAVSAAQLNIYPADVCTVPDLSCSAAPSYSGPGIGQLLLFGDSSASISDVRGIVLDGLHDAFDLYGWVSNIGSLSLSVRTDTLLSLNTFRWLVQLTNNTQSVFGGTVAFVGDLGSDQWTTQVASTSFYRITSDGLLYDPVVALVFGNNAWAAAQMSSYLGPGNHGSGDRQVTYFDLAVNPGETASLLFFAFLAKDDASRAGDVGLAVVTAEGILNNLSPYLAGISNAEFATVRNFAFRQEPPPNGDIPEPGTFLLLGSAMAAVRLLRRR